MGGKEREGRVERVERVEREKRYGRVERRKSIGAWMLLEAGVEAGVENVSGIKNSCRRREVSDKTKKCLKT